MDEIEIRRNLEGHAIRNKELQSTLISYGVALDDVQGIEHHFWVNDRMAAALLAKSLYDQGFLILDLSPVIQADGSRTWNVEAHIDQKPTTALSGEFSEQLVRLAARFQAIYDGWGMSIDK